MNPPFARLNLAVAAVFGARSLASLMAIAALVGCGGKIEPCLDGECGPTPTPSLISVPAPSTPAPRTEAPPSSPDEAGECRGPYMVEAFDGRCVWSCGVGTRPASDGKAECVCLGGTSETNVDEFGRRVCE